MCLRKELLKFVRPEPNFTYNIHDTKRLKLFKRFRLGLSHLRDHNSRTTFKTVYPQCVLADRILKQQMTSSFTAPIIILQGKSSFTR